MDVVQIVTEEQVRELARLRWEWQSDQSGNDPRADASPGDAVDAEGFADYVDRFLQWWNEVENYTVGFLAMNRGGDRAVGMVIARVMTRPPRPGILAPTGNAYINSMYVSPEYRNAGVGADVLAAADRYLESVGVTRTILHPREQAVPFYERNGYSTALNLMSKER